MSEQKNCLGIEAGERSSFAHFLTDMGNHA
jgi:hypothetical protein